MKLEKVRATMRICESVREMCGCLGMASLSLNDIAHDSAGIAAW